MFMDHDLPATAAVPNLPSLPPAITSAVELIGPREAAAFLERNELNYRADHLSTRVVNTYAEEMMAGRWTFTAEPIQLDADGNLLNGQHRLYAVLLADVTLPFLVVRGLPAEAGDAMDTGKKRGVALVLEKGAEKNSTLLAASIRVCILQERRSSGAPTARRNGNHVVSAAETKQWLAEHPLIRQAVELVSRHYREMDVPLPSVCAYALYRMLLIDPEETQRFVTDAATKVNVPAGDPVLALTRRLAEARRTRTRLSQDEMLSLLFRTWNARRQGRSMQKIAGHRGGGEVINIPEPI